MTLAVLPSHDNWGHGGKPCGMCYKHASQVPICS